MRAIWMAATLAALCACGGRKNHRTSESAPLPPPPFTAIDRGVEPAPPPPMVFRDTSPPPPPIVKNPARNFVTVIAEANASLTDAYFDYDRAEVTAEGLEALRRDAAILTPLLREFPQLEIVVEGHCDERGSAAYNLGLGARRAERAIDVLASLGIPRERLHPISYGSERPQCEVSAESCWRLNRRAHLSGRGESARTTLLRPDRAAGEPERQPE